MKKIIFMLCWIMLPAALIAQNTNPAYLLYDVQHKKTISIDELISNLKKTDVLIFGEEHNDSIGHLLEAQLFGKLNAAYPPAALSMEMFSTDVQPVISEYLSGLISEKNFVKEARAWNNYADYRPLIEMAKASKMPVIGANAATRYSNAVTFGGLAVLQQFPVISKSFLPPLPVDTATGRYYEKFTATLGGHGMGNMKIYQTQNLWDATMAWSIASFAKSNPGTKIFHVNGRFHSDEKMGVVAQLKKYAVHLHVVTISCFPAADFETPDWDKKAQLADYIVLSKP